MTTPLIGIDLGTTNSLCAFFDEDRPSLIPNAHGRFLTPSVVGVTDEKDVLVGAAAKELRVTKPDRTVSCFKRWMGTNRTLQLAGKTFTPVELSSLVLRSLKEDAEAYFKESITDAVITVPAYFNNNQRKATKQAGELAGLKVRRIINEPTAAALTYGFHDRKAEKHLMVIDLGGGTFDVTLMEIFEGNLEIISTAGESMLGGEDFTDRLLATILRKEGQQLEAAELKQPLRVARIRQECESAKRELASAQEAPIRLANSAGEFDENSATVKLTRKNFAAICQPLLKRLKGPIGQALRDGNLPPDDVNDIILIGGSTRMVVLEQMVQDYFERKPLCSFDPDQVVALGAAIQAALIIDDRAVGDMVMTDVCPYTLGVEVVKQFGRRIEDGYFQPIIHRNTTIPVSREESFSTVSTNQDEVRVRVFQGESRKVDDNLDLGELVIKGIPPGPAGQVINVRFTYDLNGILEVEGIIHETGKRFSTVIAHHAASLTDSEIEEAVQRMQKIKFYPRDDLKNRHLVLFCERIVGEISPYERTQLEEAIDMFETAMASGDRDFFERSKEGLLIMLSSMGIEYKGSDSEETDAS